LGRGRNRSSRLRRRSGLSSQGRRSRRSGNW
jgi:hypothetical protein